MRRISALLGSLLLLFVLAASPAYAYTCGGGPTLTMYADIHYGGASIIYCFQPGVGGRNAIPSFGNINGQDWNDRVSSYKWTQAGTAVIRLYQDYNYNGLYITTSGNGSVYDLRDYWPYRWADGFSDQISSALTWK